MANYSVTCVTLNDVMKYMGELNIGTWCAFELASGGISN